MTPQSIRELAIRLTRQPSVTNTPDEAAFGPFLADLLRREFPRLDRVWSERTAPGDPFPGREIVFALCRRGGPGSVLLTGHYDTVATTNFGPALEPLACNPEALTPLLIEDLRKSGANPQALADLESGDFLPGPGLLDMKGGLAAGLAVLRRFAGDPTAQGNLLFAAVPDEEVASNGMRSLVARLPQLCADLDLDLRLAINLDSEVDNGDGSQGRAIFLGSVGKLLPLVVFLGRPAHAGAPFDGVNAALLMAEFIRRVEANPETGDPLSPNPPAPPVVLYARETRDHYDVTMPQSAYCAVNVLTHTQSAAEILARFRDLAADSVHAALEILHARSGGRMPRWPGTILTVDELKRRVTGDQCEGSSIEACAAWIQRMAAKAGIEGPAAIVGFAPPFYPRAEWHGGAELLQQIEAARDPGVCIRPYFPGISDMSFLNPVADGSSEHVQANCPAPLAGISNDMRIPTVNIGPWGRDYHQKLERIHTNYAFEVLPEVLAGIVRRVLLSGSSHTRRS